MFSPPPFLAPQSAISTSSLSSYLASLTDRPDLKSGNNYVLLLGSSHLVNFLEDHFSYFFLKGHMLIFLNSQVAKKPMLRVVSLVL